MHLDREWYRRGDYKPTGQRCQTADEFYSSAVALRCMPTLCAEYRGELSVLVGDLRLREQTAMAEHLAAHGNHILSNTEMSIVSAAARHRASEVAMMEAVSEFDFLTFFRTWFGVDEPDGE